MQISELWSIRRKTKSSLDDFKNEKKKRKRIGELGNTTNKLLNVNKSEKTDWKKEKMKRASCILGTTRKKTWHPRHQCLRKDRKNKVGLKKYSNK